VIVTADALWSTETAFCPQDMLGDIWVHGDSDRGCFTLTFPQQIRILSGHSMKLLSRDHNCC